MRHFARAFTIFNVAAIAVHLYAVIPWTTRTQPLTMECDVPDALAASDDPQMPALHGFASETCDTNVISTSQFFGGSTRTSSEAETARGPVAQLSGLVADSRRPFTSCQMTACLQVIADEIATTTAAFARPSSGALTHFRVSCSIAEDGTAMSS